MKFTAVFLGSSLYQFDATVDSQAVYQACLIGIIDFFCVIIPVFLVSDTYFIKIFSAKHLDAKSRGDIEDSQIHDITNIDDFGLRET